MDYGKYVRRVWYSCNTLPHSLGVPSHEIEINGHKWKPVYYVEYPTDYYYALQAIADKKYGPETELRVYRSMCLNDPFFFAYFVMGIEATNHEWVIQRCSELKNNPNSHVLYLWAREHFKSTLITKIRTMQRLLANSEERIAIFSYSRPIAKGFLRSIKQIFESSDILKACFPDVLYNDPEKQAPKWSEDDGIVLKRKGYYGESSLEAWGLIEGMPTSKHFSGRVYDDIETDTTTGSPEMMDKLKMAFELSQNLGTADGWHNVVGTTYHHQGLLEYLKAKKAPDGQSIYHLSLHAATHDRTPNGKPVLLTEKRLNELRASPRTFYAQQLLDPTPKGTAVLNPELVREVLHSDLPKNLYKFMLVDPAGVDNYREGDAWAIMVVGVEPFAGDVGASKLYILDMSLQPFSEAEALDEIVRMYIRNGRILKLGVEKVAMNSTEVHVANALRVKGRIVSQDIGNLVLLRPAGRSKVERIEKSLCWPLVNGMIHMLGSIPKAYKDRIKTEMERFPYWHDDGIDALAYAYDVISEYKFSRFSNPDATEEKKDKWDKAFDKLHKHEAERRWMVV